MNITECIKNRRSIHKYQPSSIDHSIFDSIVSLVSFFSFLKKHPDYLLYSN